MGGGLRERERERERERGNLVVVELGLWGLLKWGNLLDYCFYCRESTER